MRVGAGFDPMAARIISRRLLLKAVAGAVFVGAAIAHAQSYPVKDFGAISLIASAALRLR